MDLEKRKKIIVFTIIAITFAIVIVGAVKILDVLRTAQLAADYSVMSSLSAAIYNYLSDPESGNIFAEKRKPISSYVLNNEEYDTLVSVIMSKGLLTETPKGWDKISILTDSKKRRYEVEIRQLSSNRYEVVVRRKKFPLNNPSGFDCAVTRPLVQSINSPAGK